MERRLSAILAADVVGYSSLMEVDETGTLERLKLLYRELMQPQIKERKGRIVKLMGDGLLAEFPSVIEAIQCAANIQESLATRETDRPADDRLQMRIGINLGDVIVEGEDIYGDGVNVAARLEGLAEPGGVCISGPVFDIIDGKLDLAFENIGEQRVKNIVKPVRAYRLELAATASSARPRLTTASNLLIRPSIAVLPFAEMENDFEQMRFGDGLAADINRELTRSGMIEVIGHQVSKRHNLDSDRAADIARSLDVGYLLSGSIRHSGERIRISAELLDANTGRPHWSERYDRALNDPLEVQDEIARAIAGIVEPSMVRLERDRIARNPPEHMKPHELHYLAWKLSDEGSREGVRAGEQYCEQAIKLDPGYSDAHSQLAWVLWIDALSGWGNDPEASMQRALACAEKALSLNPRDYDALGARGATLIALGKYDAAAKVVDELAKRFPAHAYGLSYQSLLLNSLGQHEAALELANQAMATNPEHDQWFWIWLGRCLFQLERYPEAVEALEQFKALSEFRYASLLLAASYAASGRSDEAKAEIASLGPDWENLIPCIALCHCKIADRDRLTKWAKAAASTEFIARDQR